MESAADQGRSDLSATGIRPATVVPAPCSLRTSSVPPMASSRSAMPCRPVPYAVAAGSKPSPSSTTSKMSRPSCSDAASFLGAD